MILLVLAGAWAAFLIVPYVKRRGSSRPSSSVTSFNQHLSTLARTAPGSRTSTSELPRIPVQTSGGPTIPRSRAEARRRRREVLMVLAACAALTLVLAVALGGPAVLVHLAIDAALAGYVYLLVQFRKAGEQNAKVTPLHQGHHVADQPLLLRRAASS